MKQQRFLCYKGRNFKRPNVWRTGDRSEVNCTALCTHNATWSVSCACRRANPHAGGWNKNKHAKQTSHFVRLGPLKLFRVSLMLNAITSSFYPYSRWLGSGRPRQSWLTWPSCVHWILAWLQQSHVRRTERHGYNSWQRRRPWQAPERIRALGRSDP